MKKSGRECWKPNMLIPGIVSATFKNLDAEQVVALAVENHLQAIEWSENWHIKEGDCSKADHVLHLCTEAGIRIAAFGSYYRLGSFANFASRLSVAQALKTSVIRIWAGDKPSSQVEEKEYQDLVAEARELAQLSETFGITLALEWHRNTLTDTNESALAFLDSVGKENVKSLWQPTPALNFEQRKAGLSRLKSKLVNLHVYHWDDSGRRPLAEGIDQWNSYCSLVDSCEDHYALLEFVKDDSIQQFEDDASVLLTLLDGMQRNR